MGLLNVFKAATPEGQDWLDKLLRDAGSVDLPDKAVDQAYATVPFYNVGKENVVSYDLNAPRANNINAPAGIYSNVEKKWSDNYLKSQEEFSGQPRVQNTLVTTGRNVFVAGADKPTEQMLQSVREQMSREAAGISYGDLPFHQRDYIDEKINAFAATGDPTTLPTGFINAQDKNKIFTDAGFDILLRNGNEFVHLKPEQTRSIDAEFNPELKGTNNWMAGVGGLGLLGAGAMQSENAAAESLSDEDRYMRDVETARQMAASEDPAIQQRGTAWLEKHGNLIDDKADQKMFGRTSVLDQPLWLAQAGETAIRDILGIPAGIYSPELGDRIREERLLPATKGTDYYDEQVSGALGEALTPFIAGASKLAKMPFDAATAMYAANPSAMAMPVQGLPSESGSLTDVISSASEEYDKMTEEQKRNVKRLGYGLEAASYFPPVYGLMKLIEGAK